MWRGFLALMVVSLTMGAYTTQYQGWPIHYGITPLMDLKRIAVLRTTGATIGSYTLGDGDGGYAAIIEVEAPIELHFRVGGREAHALSQAYWRLSFSIEVFSPGEDGALGTGDDVLIDSLLLLLVEDGKGMGEVDGKIPLEDLLPRGQPDYGIVIRVNYWTKAVEGRVRGLLVLKIYAVKRV